MSEAFSSKTTEIPANDNRRATAQPITPPPMIAVLATPSKEDLLLSTFFLTTGSSTSINRFCDIISELIRINKERI
jgi:hypothetical protein